MVDLRVLPVVQIRDGFNPLGRRHRAGLCRNVVVGVDRCSRALVRAGVPYSPQKNERAQVAAIAVVRHSRSIRGDRVGAVLSARTGLQRRSCRQIDVITRDLDVITRDRALSAEIFLLHTQIGKTELGKLVAAIGLRGRFRGKRSAFCSPARLCRNCGLSWRG